MSREELKKRNSVQYFLLEKWIFSIQFYLSFHFYISVITHQPLERSSRWSFKSLTSHFRSFHTSVRYRYLLYIETWLNKNFSQLNVVQSHTREQIQRFQVTFVSNCKLLLDFFTFLHFFFIHARNQFCLEEWSFLLKIPIFADELLQ